MCEDEGDLRGGNEFIPFGFQVRQTSAIPAATTGLRPPLERSDNGTCWSIVGLTHPDWEQQSPHHTSFDGPLLTGIPWKQGPSSIFSPMCIILTIIQRPARTARTNPIHRCRKELPGPSLRGV